MGSFEIRQHFVFRPVKSDRSEVYEVADELTDIIRKEIKKQYRSTRAFSVASGIPYSTLANALSKGVGVTAFDTVMRMCDVLGVNYNSSVNGSYSDRMRRMGMMYASLDADGENVVERVLRSEYIRCRYDEIKKRAGSQTDMEGVPEHIQADLRTELAADELIKEKTEEK